VGIISVEVSILVLNYEGFLFPLTLLALIAVSSLLIKEKCFKKEEPLAVRDLWLIKEKIKLMSSRSFEYFCATLFAKTGYRVAEVTKASRDGGKDIILEKNGEYIFVECKHWKDCIDKNISENNNYEFDDVIKNASPVTQDIAQKLKGVMDYGFDGKKPIKKGIIITTTRFSEQCQKYCNAMNIEMYDMDKIMNAVQQIGTQNMYVAVGIKSNGWDILDDSIGA
jgi:hypothetical protein